MVPLLQVVSLKVECVKKGVGSLDTDVKLHKMEAALANIHRELQEMQAALEFCS
jgi:hypothetical protein